MVLPLLAIGVGAVSAVVRGIAAKKQIEGASKAEQRQAEHQARAYIRNSRYRADEIRRGSRSTALDFLTQAEVHERQKFLERERGSYNAARLQERGQRVIGGQVAGYGAGGIAIEGTIAEVVRSTAEEVAKDVAATRRSAVIASTNESILENINRKNARRAISQGEKSARDVLKHGRQAAKDALELGAANAANIQSGAGVAIAAPTVAQVGTFIQTGVFQQ